MKEYQFPVDRRENLVCWLSLIVGVIAFYGFSGFGYLNPVNVDWLMDGDPAQHFLGWQFFRQAPLFEFPIGANPNYGMELGSSIVFTDSIPLMAFLFKPLNPLLPKIFQYTGLWLLICMLLQSYFACRLMGVIVRDVALRLIGGAFFVIAPVYLLRTHGHFSLSSQWVILGGLCLYFSKKHSNIRWLILLVVTTLIHAYLVVMVGALWAAELMQRYWKKEGTVRQTVLRLLSGCSVVLITMWITGYFMAGEGIETGGFGIYRFNLLSLINPADESSLWSRLLPSQKQTCGDYEGFAFLGSGMICLLLVALAGLARRQKLPVNYKTVTPLVLISICLTVYAISNRIVIGDCELFSYKVPHCAQKIVSIFRVSGRMFWPVLYIGYFSIFYLVFTGFSHRKSVIICSALLLLQIFDSRDSLRFLRNKINAAKWSSPMRSQLWGELANQYKKAIIVMPQNQYEGWIPLSYFAMENQMSINAGYFARIDSVKQSKEIQKLSRIISRNELEPDSLYVFENNNAWSYALLCCNSSAVTGVLDGFRIIAPRLDKSSLANKDMLSDIKIAKGFDFAYNQEKLSFAAKGNGEKFTLMGWSKPEDFGIWSDGNDVSIMLQIADKPKGNLQLTFEGHAFVVKKHPVQRVEVFVNNHLLETVEYRSSANIVQTIEIPVAVAGENQGRLLIQFRMQNPAAPAQLGLGNDNRQLGLGLVSLQLKRVE